MSHHPTAATQQPMPMDLVTMDQLSHAAKNIAADYPTESQTIHRYIEQNSAAMPIAPPEMTETEEAAIGQIVAERRAPATVRIYNGKLKSLSRWLYLRTGASETRPLHPVTLVLYLLHLHEEGKSESAISQTIAAVKHHHTEANLSDPTADARVKAFLAGSRRVKKTRSPKQARPLTQSDLELLAKLKSKSDKETVALISMMRDAMLRVSEASRVTWSDIDEQNDGSATLYIPFSKTDQTGEGNHRYLTRDTMTRLKKDASRDLTEPIFAYHPDTLTRRISKACADAGLGDGYTGHSPRVGMATDLVRRGASTIELQREGRWANPSMPAHYVRNEEAKHGAVARLMETAP